LFRDDVVRLKDMLSITSCTFQNVPKFGSFLRIDGMDAKIAHLGFIQGVITRMGANSFYLKGWSVALVVGIFTLSAKDADHRYILLAYFPVFMFWILDAYFLRQERLFRKLYDAVSQNLGARSEFSMNVKEFEDQVSCVSITALSKTLISFHGVIALVVLVAMFQLKRVCS
jgi:hypothetical protein